MTKIEITGHGGIITTSSGEFEKHDVTVMHDPVLVLDGSADYLKATSADFRTSDSSGAVTAWVKSDDWNLSSHQQHIFSCTDEATGNYYIRIFFNTDGKLYIKHMDSSVIYDLKSTTVLSDDGYWHHIAIVSTGTAIKMYIDGVEETVVVANGTNNGDWFGDVTDSKLDHVIIGALHDNAGVRAMFDGSIADVRYYSEAPSDAQIKELASEINGNTCSAHNLQHWWKLNSDDISSSGLGEDYGDATDIDLTPNSIVADTNFNYKGFELDILPESGSTSELRYVNVKQGVLNPKSLNFGEFDGTNDFISTSDASDLSFGDSSVQTPFSFAAWVNMDDATNFPIMSKGVYNTAGEYLLWSDGSDKLEFRVFDEDVDDCFQGVVYDTAITSFQSKWIHVVATSGVTTESGTDVRAKMKLYLNGEQVNDATSGNNAASYDAMVDGSANMYIGRYDSNYADGNIRDVRIYNLELGPKAVSALYANQYPIKPTQWWKIDETSGVASDSGTGTARDGSLSSATRITGTLQVDGLRVYKNGGVN